MVAQLPEECFALVMEIEQRFKAGELPKVTKSQAITQSFFKFLVGKSSEESYELLKSVRDGHKTTTELNYVPTGKVNHYTIFTIPYHIISPYLNYDSGQFVLHVLLLCF